MVFFPPADVLPQPIDMAAEVLQRPSASLGSGCLIHWGVVQQRESAHPEPRCWGSDRAGTGRGQSDGSPLLICQAKWSCGTEDHQAVQIKLTPSPKGSLSLFVLNEQCKYACYIPELSKA